MKRAETGDKYLSAVTCLGRSPGDPGWVFVLGSNEPSVLPHLWKSIKQEEVDPGHPPRASVMPDSVYKAPSLPSPASLLASVPAGMAPERA